MPSVPEVYSDITIVGGLLAKAGSCRFMGLFWKSVAKSLKALALANLSSQFP